MNPFISIKPVMVNHNDWKPIPRDNNGNIRWSEFIGDCFFGGFDSKGVFMYFFCTRNAHVFPVAFDDIYISHYCPVRVNAPEKSAIQLAIEKEAFILFPEINKDKYVRDQFIAGAMFAVNKMAKQYKINKELICEIKTI